MLRPAIWLLGMVAGCLVTPSESAAQTSATAGSLPAFRVPSVMISAGLGIANDSRSGGNSKPLPPTVSVQFLPTRHLVVEVEWVRWEKTWDYREPYRPGGDAVNGERVHTGAVERWSGAVNLLYRTEPRRVSVFVGGGPVLLSELYDDSIRLEGCVSTRRGECWGPYEYRQRDTYPRIQAVTGADVLIAGPILAYVSVQYNPWAYVRALGGVRFVAISRRTAPPGRKT